MALLRRRRAARSDDELRQSLALGILTGRQAARTLGRGTVAALFSVSASISPATRLIDASRSYEIARSHVAQVKFAEAKAAVEGLENPARQALIATEYRVRSIAATETFHAASEERLTAAREVQSELGIVLEKEWNAQHDSCPVCVSLDGTVVGLNDTFPGGTEPGGAHVGCRCWLELLTREGRKVA